MSRMISILVDDDTYDILLRIAAERGDTIDNLAANAVIEAARDAGRQRRQPNR